MQIFKDTWVVTKQGYKMEWPSDGGQTPDLRVQELIGQNQEWDENVVRRSFNDMDPSFILNMPLMDAPSKDQMIWTYINNGRVTVKSVYHRLKEQGGAMAHGSSTNYNVWRAIWKVNTVPKILKLYVAVTHKYGCCQQEHKEKWVVVEEG